MRLGQVRLMGEKKKVTLNVGVEIQDISSAFVFDKLMEIFSVGFFKFCVLLIDVIRRNRIDWSEEKESFSKESPPSALNSVE